MEVLGEYEPAFVSSVDYGRMLIAFVSANMTEWDLQTELSAGMQALDKGVEGFVGFMQEEEEKDISCKYYCLGGDFGEELKEAGSNEINKMITEGDAFVNPVPLVYRLNYLSDNSAVPAVAIISDDLILAEDAKLVTFALQKD